MKPHFSDWIEAYLDYTSASEAPDAFHRWTAIATIAGALRRRVWIEMGYFRWYPNFFLCFVAPPGIVSKSTTADIGMSLLRRVPGIKFGPSAITWQALIPSLVEAREDYPQADGTFLPMCALTFVASELGTLFQPNDQSIINVLTDLWDGREDTFRKRTKKDGEEIIENPWVHLIACTTPAWIAENFSSYFIGGGFASRTLFIYAEHKRQLVAYPGIRLAPGHSTLGDKLVRDLEQIALVEGRVHLSSDAQEWGTDWYYRHHTATTDLRTDSRFGGYFARKQTHVHKTAMVIAASRGHPLDIGRVDLEDAVTLVTELEPDMLTVFGQMNKEAITDQMAQVLTVIRSAKRIRRDALYQGFVTKMGYATFDECVTGLAQAGLIGFVQEGPAIVVRYLAEGLEARLT